MSCDIQHHPNYVTLEIDEQMLTRLVNLLESRCSFDKTAYQM